MAQPNSFEWISLRRAWNEIVGQPSDETAGMQKIGVLGAEFQKGRLHFGLVTAEGFSYLFQRLRTDFHVSSGLLCVGQIGPDNLIAFF